MFPTLPRTAAALAAATLLPGLAVVATTSSAQAGIVAFCDDEPATIIGTDGRDNLEGTDGPDVIAALGGADTVQAGDGEDIVCGGSGNDDLTGGAGNDRLFGEAGRDGLNGGENDDLLQGGAAGDFITGDDGDDELRGEAGRDFLITDAGADLIIGGTSAQDIVTYASRKRGVAVDLTTGSGADDGAAIDGPRGARDEIRDVERVIGSRGADTLYGDRKANRFEPFLGRDLVRGRGGDDYVLLDDGLADDANGGAGRDRVRFDPRRDKLRNFEARIPVQR